MLTRVRRALTFAASAAAAAQVGVAATWVPGVRRMLVPSLLGRGRPSSVALTFDDGPHPQGTPAMLDTLDQLGWKATFFVLGTQARRHPEIVSETVRRGHEIAVHGDEHRYLIARSPWTAYDDLRRSADTVTDIAGVAMSVAGPTLATVPLASTTTRPAGISVPSPNHT